MKKTNKTPWSQEIVDGLNKHQQSGAIHPYTCGRNHPECEVVNRKDGEWEKDGVLIATTEGWVCPCGKYKQDWF